MLIKDLGSWFLITGMTMRGILRDSARSKCCSQTMKGGGMSMFDVLLSYHPVHKWKSTFQLFWESREERRWGVGGWQDCLEPTNCVIGSTWGTSQVPERKSWMAPRRVLFWGPNVYFFLLLCGACGMMSADGGEDEDELFRFCRE
jgi:hypothetical protein